jgi:hypothetical protein
LAAFSTAVPLLQGFPPLRGRVTFFAAAKKVTKESGFSPREQQLVAQIFKGIFRLGILPRRKTAHIPVRRPMGLRAGGSPQLCHQQRQAMACTESASLLLSGKGPFLLVTFLWALAQKSNSLAQQ